MTTYQNNLVFNIDLEPFLAVFENLVKLKVQIMQTFEEEIAKKRAEGAIYKIVKQVNRILGVPGSCVNMSPIDMVCTGIEEPGCRSIGRRFAGAPKGMEVWTWKATPGETFGIKPSQIH